MYFLSRPELWQEWQKLWNFRLLQRLIKAKEKISAQLTQALREAVQSGDLQPGDPLPSSRELALTLGVARGTIIEAYDQLLAEGVFDSQPRTGTYVSHALVKTPVIQHSSKENKPNSISLTKSARSYAKVVDEFKPLPHVPFAVSVPVGRTQPSDIWRKFGNKFRSREQVLHQVMANLKGYYH